VRPVFPNYSENRPRAFRARSRFDALSIPRNNIHSAARKSSPRHQQCLPTETLQSVRHPARPIFATDRTRSNRERLQVSVLSLSLSVFIVIARTFMDDMRRRVLPSDLICIILARDLSAPTCVPSDVHGSLSDRVLVCNNVAPA